MRRQRHAIEARPLRASLTGLAAAAVVFGGAGCPRGGGGGGAVRAPGGIAASGWSVGADRLGADRISAIAAMADDVVAGSERADGAGAVRRIGADGAIAWTRELPAAPRAIAVGAGAIAVAIEGEADAAAVAAAGLGGLPDGLRGEPGAAVVLLGEDGAPRTTIGVGATRWAMVKAVAFDGDALLVAGAFAGTLRIGGALVTADGNADGFSARIDGAARAGGDVAGGAHVELRRLGGDGFDSVNGLAVLTDGRLAIAGTFTGRAELGELTLDSAVGDPVAGDGFVAVLERGGAVAWARTWGGDLEDTGAGVAALAGGELALAGTVSGDVEVAGRRLTTAGPSDGLVAVLDGNGDVRGAQLVGGSDVDTVTAIAAAPGGSRAIVAGRFNGTLATRGGAVASPGADASFVALVDRDAVLAAAPIATAAATVDVLLAAEVRGWVLAASAAAPFTFAADHLSAGPALLRRPW